MASNKNKFGPWGIRLVAALSLVFVLYLQFLYLPQYRQVAPIKNKINHLNQLEQQALTESAALSATVKFEPTVLQGDLVTTYNLVQGANPQKAIKQIDSWQADDPKSTSLSRSNQELKNLRLRFQGLYPSFRQQFGRATRLANYDQQLTQAVMDFLNFDPQGSLNPANAQQNQESSYNYLSAAVAGLQKAHDRLSTLPDNTQIDKQKIIDLIDSQKQDTADLQSRIKDSNYAISASIYFSRTQNRQNQLKTTIADYWNSQKQPRQDLATKLDSSRSQAADYELLLKHLVGEK